MKQMQARRFGLWLALTGGLLNQPGRAQQGPVAPRELVRPVVQLPQLATPTTYLGVPLPKRSNAPLLAATAQRPVYLPVYLLNKQVIIGGLEKIKPSDIQNIVVYKGDDTPVQWRSLVAHGIVSLTVPNMPRLKTKTLASIRRHLKLAGPVRYELDGMPLEDTSLRIAADAIGEVEVRPTAAGEAATVLNIRVLRPEPKPTPPGIYIRGVASR